MRRVTDGVVDVVVYPSSTDKTKNRGFAFVEYESHRAAALARKKIIPGKLELWGQLIIIDWAEPELVVDDDVMDKVMWSACLLFLRLHLVLYVFSNPHICDPGPIC